MTAKQKKLNNIHNAMSFTGEKPENGTRSNIYLINEKCEPELKNVLMKLIYDENIGGNQDLSYEIVAQACNEIPDTIEELNEADFYENECASVYTADRLAYLNPNNESEISDKMKELDLDIQTACAVWYDDMIREAMYTLRDYVNNED